MADKPVPNYPLVEYLKTEGRVVRQINAALRAGLKDLQKSIAALDDGTSIGNQVNRMQLIAQREAIQRFLDMRFNSIEQIIAAGHDAAAAAASRVINGYEDTLLSGSFTAAERQAIYISEAARASAGLETTLARLRMSKMTLSEQVYKTNTLSRGLVNSKVNSALIRGLGWKEFAKEIEGLIDPNVAGGVSYAAQRLARTEINNAFHAVSAEQMNNSPFVETVDWNLSKSHPEKDICDEYAENSPYSPNAVPMKPHPQDLCYITPNTPDEDAFVRMLFSGKYDEYLGLSGVSPRRR